MRNFYRWTWNHSTFSFQKDPNLCSNSALSDLMPDIAMATSSISQMGVAECDVAPIDLELDLGDRNTHYCSSGTLYLWPRSATIRCFIWFRITDMLRQLASYHSIQQWFSTFFYPRPVFLSTDEFATAHTSDILTALLLTYKYCKRARYV